MQQGINQVSFSIPLQARSTFMTIENNAKSLCVHQRPRWRLSVKSTLGDSQIVGALQFVARLAYLFQNKICLALAIFPQNKAVDFKLILIKESQLIHLINLFSIKHAAEKTENPNTHKEYTIIDICMRFHVDFRRYSLSDDSVFGRQTR